MNPHVLVVEDEPKLARVLQDYLQAEGFDTTLLDDGAAVLPWLAEHQADALLLDLMLPNRDGFSILRDLRTSGSTVPVLVTTARVEEFDRLLGLDLGADDYICKPYSPREVVARVRAVLRRGQAAVSASELEIDAATHQARVHGRGVDLTPVEFRLLAQLAGHPQRVFSREQLMDVAYTDGRVVSDRTMDSHVKNLRRKLGDAGARVQIEAVYGVGYRLVPGEGE